MTADLSTLIARLEAAEVGSRELDWAVGAALFTGVRGCAAPNATTSLDAALALAERVLPGWRVFGISDERDFQVNRGWGAGVGEKTGPGIQHAKAPTPALALVIAVLRAKLGEGE